MIPFTFVSPGYIDPGTMQHMFGVLGPILAMIGAAVAFLFWPIRLLMGTARRRYRALPRYGRVTVWVLAAVCAIGGGTAVYGLLIETGGESVAKWTGKPGTFQRVLVLGMDGLDPGIIKQMMAAGELPHFASLDEKGGFSPLQTSTPPESPVAWSNIATGTQSGEHGIFDFLHRDADKQGRFQPQGLYLSLRRHETGLFGTKYKKARKQDGFWAYTSAAKVPTTVIRWPVAFPADQERVTGNFFSGFGVPDLLGGEGKSQYFTSASVAGEEIGNKEAVTEVAWDGERLETTLKGPAISKDKFANLALIVERADDDRLKISVEGTEPIEAVTGQWTSFVPLRFSVGFGKKVYGQVKFLLTEVQPNLRLIASPIHMDPEHQAFAFTWPASFGAELQERLGRFHTLGMPEQLHPLSDRWYDYDAFLAECDAVHRERRQMLSDELERFQSGLLAFVFDTSDRVQHAFWATREPEHPAYDPEEAEAFGHVIPDMYREMDSVLGEVLSKIDPETALIVLSDHGFNSFRRAVHVNRWLIENGYMHLAGGNGKEGRSLFGDVDWSKTRAYSLGFSSIYLNLANREPSGIVLASEAADLRREMAGKLLGWDDPEPNQPLVHAVYEGREIYSGPLVGEGPDLVVGLKPGYRFSAQTVLGGAPLPLIEDNRKRWSGDHLIDPSFVPGVLFTNQKLKNSQPGLADIGPTVLHCFGITPPDHMKGSPLF